MKHSIYELLNKYTLKFLDQEIEEKYKTESEENSHNEFTLKMMLILFVILTCLQIIYLIVRVLLVATGKLNHLDLTIEIITLASFISSFGLEIILFFFSNKFFHFLRGFPVKIINFLCAFLYMSYYNSSVVLLIPVWFPISVISILIVQIISCRKMLESVIQFLCTGISIICFLNISQKKIPLIDFFQLLVMGIFALICWAGFCYFFEISFRKDFYEIYVTRKMNKTLRNLFRQIPIPLVILSQDEISQHNKEFDKFFNIKMNNHINEQNSERNLKKTEINTEIISRLSELKRENSNKSFWNDIIDEKPLKEILDSLYIKIINNEPNFIKVKGSNVFYENKEANSFFFTNLSEKDLMQKRIEKKYQHMIIASFSHEIRTPIVAGSSTIEELLAKITEIDTRVKLKIIDVAFKKLTYFISIIHNYSLIQASNFQPFYERFSLKLAILEVTKIFKLDVKMKRLSFNINFRNNIEHVCCDKLRLQQILFILLGNSCKYTNEGEINLTIYLEDSFIHIIVKDTGCGIKESRLENLFVMFSDNSNLSSLNPQGIGLSLYVAKNVSLLLKGDLKINSRENLGTTAHFYLNYGIPDSNSDLISSQEIFETMKDEEEIIQPSECLQGCLGKDILIVDDDATCLKILESYFNKIELQVDKAMNGEQAINYVNEKIRITNENYKIIFMDINMPILDGEKATKILKTKMKTNEMPNCPIIALTATQIQSREHENQFKEFGFDLIVQKPMNKKTFDTIIKKYVFN